MTTLAIHGGEPYRKQPFPPRKPFDDREIELHPARQPSISP
jgi:hypothetical protein